MTTGGRRPANLAHVAFGTLAIGAACAKAEASGCVAVGTRYAQAIFDDVKVTAP